MAHSYTNLLVHVLFSTKNREKKLSAEIRKNLSIFSSKDEPEDGGWGFLRSWGSFLVFGFDLGTGESSSGLW